MTCHNERAFDAKTDLHITVIVVYYVHTRARCRYLLLQLQGWAKTHAPVTEEPQSSSKRVENDYYASRAIMCTTTCARRRYSSVSKNSITIVYYYYNIPLSSFVFVRPPPPHLQPAVVRRRRRFACEIYRCKNRFLNNILQFNGVYRPRKRIVFLEKVVG